MSKSNIKTLQSDEQKVLDILKLHGDLKMELLAKMTGFSKKKIWHITKKLEETGMIWGYTAIDDIEKQDLILFILLVKRSIKPFSDTFRNEVIQKHLDDYLPGEVTVLDIYITHGSFDAIVTFLAKDINVAKKLVDMIMKTLGVYLKEIQLIRTILPVRMRGIKNPDIKKLVEFL